MSEIIKHECGIALIRLLKPLEYYSEKYGSWRYGINKLYLLMEKQHNRGQDGAGIACIKLDTQPGDKYINRIRSNDKSALDDLFSRIKEKFNEIEIAKNTKYNDPVWAKKNINFAAELYLGHLRYGTYGKNKLRNVHPVMRQNNWKTRNLILAGNFNLTNVKELFQKLVELGQCPKDFSDTITILENIGHFLDRENQKLFDFFHDQGYSNVEISSLIARDLNVANILQDASKRWDGGYVIAGLIGHGDAFVVRDPWGIRPAYYYHDEEIAVVASERPAIQTAFNLSYSDIKELKPGYAFIIKKDGRITEEEIRKPKEKKSCSFERIYFSRGTDAEIYRERKKLGELLTPLILNSINYDLVNTVFSYIPNTAESAFYGMIDGIHNYLFEENKKKIIAMGKNIDVNEILKMISFRPRIEKIAHKDIKLRTFISKDEGRDELVGHVYDITYETIKKDIDNLVIIDDSIVRGTTLKQSILRILDRLNPKKIIVVSSSPQIRYPDCYGIDMAKLSDFVAFKAAIELLKENNLQSIIDDVFNKAKMQDKLNPESVENYVKEIYKPFTAEQISDKIAQMLKNSQIKAEIKIVYQTIENLHIACQNHKGDWYFTGDYPTTGGNIIANQSFINYYEGKNIRAYQY
jgi:amidophosphoribosyltransferase